MEGHLQAHDWPFRGVAAPSCWKSRFWVVEIARLPALIFGRRKALYFTGDTTKSSFCILQTCVVGAQTDGIPLYLLYSPDVFSFSLNIFWRGLGLRCLVFPSVILNYWEKSQAFSNLKTHTHTHTHTHTKLHCKFKSWIRLFWGYDKAGSPLYKRTLDPNYVSGRWSRLRFPAQMALHF